VLHPMAEYSSTPQRGTRVPLEYPLWVHSRETHGRQRELEIATVRFGLRDLVAYSSDAI
jgi:hypothetical protein